MTAASAQDDGLVRCPWALTHPDNLHYHDTEWGLPVHGEQAWFERVCLESFQAGLSWLTILRKRPAFRTAFDGFDVDRVAAFTEDDAEHLMQNPDIVRNRAKINAAVTNARAAQQLRSAGGIEALLTAYRDCEHPRPRTADEVPTTSPASHAMARELRAAGFRFVGPVTCYALMEATGLIDTHLLDCHRRGSRDLEH